MRVALRGEGRALAADYDASDRLRGAAPHGARRAAAGEARSARLDIDDLPRRVRIRVPGDGTFFADADGGVGSLGVAVAAARRGEARRGVRLRAALRRRGRASRCACAGCGTSRSRASRR